MRRYSDDDLARVARIRELQTLLGLNLDEIAIVLRNEDRMAEIRLAYHDERTSDDERLGLLRECLTLQEGLRDDRRGQADRAGELPGRPGRAHQAGQGSAGRPRSVSAAELPALSGYYRMLMAREITSAASPRDTAASTIISSLAHGLIADTSVGLNAVAVQKASDR